MESTGGEFPDWEVRPVWLFFEARLWGWRD